MQIELLVFLFWEFYNFIYFYAIKRKLVVSMMLNI